MANETAAFKSTPLRPYDSSMNDHLSMYDHIPYKRDVALCNRETIALFSGNIIHFYTICEPRILDHINELAEQKISEYIAAQQKHKEELRLLEEQNLQESGTPLLEEPDIIDFDNNNQENGPSTVNSKIAATGDSSTEDAENEPTDDGELDWERILGNSANDKSLW